MSQNGMSEGQQGPADSEAWSPAQLSQALRDLARGEQTANALENNLSKLESKLDELLASFGDNVGDVPAEKDAGAPDTKSSGQEPDDDAKDLEKKTD